MNSKLLSNLVTLNTLKVLNILTARKAETALFPPLKNTVSNIESNTIKPSKIFILSLI